MNASDYLFGIWQVKQQQKYLLWHSCCLGPVTKGPANVHSVSGSFSWDLCGRLTGVREDHGVISICIHLLGIGLHEILCLSLPAVNWSLPVNCIEKKSGEDPGSINISVFPCSLARIVPALFSGISSEQKIRSKKGNWDFPSVLLTLENEDGIIATGSDFHWVQTFIHF